MSTGTPLLWRPQQQTLISMLRPGTPTSPGVSAYRCFLPDLAGFTGLRRAGPNLQRRWISAVLRRSTPREGNSTPL